MHTFHAELKAVRSEKKDWRQQVCKAELAQLEAIRQNTRAWQDW